MCGDGYSMAIMSDQRSTLFSQRFLLASAKAQPEGGLEYKVFTNLWPDKWSEGFACPLQF